MIAYKNEDPRVEKAYDAALMRIWDYDCRDCERAERHVSEIVKRYVAEDYTAAEALSALAKV